MIIFDGVTKRYPDGTVAVAGLDLEAPSGAITVLVGPSGCGKTTTLRMINRMTEHTEGRLLLDGEDVRGIEAPALRRRTGYVIQHAGLFPHRKIIDNVATVPLLCGWGKKEARERARELLDLVGLSQSLADRYPFQLSGGQQQRVGVARALAADPPVMLMDEPFSAVDPIVRATLQEELLRLQGELHKTIVFVTHDIDEAIKLGDRVAVFAEGGHLAQVDAPERLLAAPKDEFVESFLGVDRGIRRLSFFDAGGLALHDNSVVPDTATSERAREVASATDEPWVLVVNGEHRPLGWVNVDELPADGSLGEAALKTFGHTFEVGADSLRSALDGAVLSPSGHAVGVDTEGRVVGVATQDELGQALRRTDHEYAS